MLERFRLLGAVAILVAAAADPAHAADGISSTVVPLPPPAAAASLVRAADGNLWFTVFDNAAGKFGYIVRMTPVGLSYYRLPPFTRSGLAQQTLPIGLTNAPPNGNAGPLPHGRGPLVPLPPPARQLVFSWVTADAVHSLFPTDAGLGTIDIDHPSRIVEYASQNPGDPLYSPSLILDPNTYTLVATASPPMIWANAHALPTSESSPEFVVALPFPIRAGAPLRAFPIGGATTTGYTAFNALTLGADGDIWYVAQRAIGRISPSGASEFPLQFGPFAIAAGGQRVWVSAFPTRYAQQLSSGLLSVRYSGASDVFYPWAARLGFDFLFFAPTRAAIWSLSWNGDLGVVYFMRMAPSGQWSAYSVPSPLGSGRYTPSSILVTTDGTIWGAFWNPQNAPLTAALISMKSSRVLSALPLRLFLHPGQSAFVSVSETNNSSATFSFSIPEGCPVTVQPGAGAGTFVVSGLPGSADSFYCGVTFSDAEGISVWVPLLNERQLGPQYDPRMQPLEQFRPFPFAGRR